jgi:hypothetical protein
VETFASVETSYAYVTVEHDGASDAVAVEEPLRSASTDRRWR